MIFSPNISAAGKEILSVPFQSDVDPEKNYTKWAATYDSDLLDELGFSSSDCTAEIAARHLIDHPRSSGSNDSNKKVQLLDVGCGTGAVGVFLREKYDFGKNATTEGGEIDGSDLTQAMLDVAASRPGIYRNLKKWDISHTPWPYQSGLYDMVTCSGVLLYIKENDIMNVMKEFHRVLKVGGKAVLMFRDDDSSKCQPALTFLEDSGAWTFSDESGPRDNFGDVYGMIQKCENGNGCRINVKVFTKSKEL